MAQAIDISYKGMLKVAVPISLGAFVEFAVLFTDNTFLSSLSETHMNAAGNAGLVYISLLMLAIGLDSGIQILVARRHGEQQFVAAGRILGQGMRMALVLGVLLLLICQAGRLMFPQWIDDPELLSLMDSFMGIRAWGFLIYPLTLSILGFYMGVARTVVMLFCTLITAGVNIGLDYALIFGNFGFPEMGIRGAALATFFAEASTLLFILGYAAFDKKLKPYRVFEGFRRGSIEVVQRIFRISLPIAIQQLIAVATWTVFFFFAAELGREPLTTSHIIRNMYWLIFAAMMGVGQTTRTYVSTLIAEQRQGELKLVLKRLIILNVIGWVILSHGMWLYPSTIASVFTDEQAIIDMTVRSMYVVILAMFIACFSSVLINTIEGSGKTRVAMFIEILGSLVYLVVAYLMCVRYPQPIEFVWMNDWLYFALMTTAAFIFLKTQPWKEHQI